jgi:hypothetical protein
VVYKKLNIAAKMTNLKTLSNYKYTGLSQGGGGGLHPPSFLKISLPFSQPLIILICRCKSNNSSFAFIFFEDFYIPLNFEFRGEDAVRLDGL